MNPELFQTVCQTLVNVLQGDDVIQKSAEQQINVYFRTPGFHTVLHAIVTSGDTSSQGNVLKQSAVMMFLRMVKDYWEEKDGYVINPEEKNQIRINLISMLSMNELTQMISGQVIHMLTHIIFLDFPSQWPSVFMDFSDMLVQDNMTQRVRILILIHHSLKTIASKPHLVPFDDPRADEYRAKKEKLESLTPQIFTTISSLWNQASTMMLSDLAEFLQGKRSEDSLRKDVGQIAQYALKSMHVIFKHFFAHFADRSPNVCLEFFKVVLQYLSSTIDCRVALESNQIFYTEYVEKSILSYLKLVNDSQDNHPLTFVPLLLPYLEFYYVQLQRTELPMFAPFWAKFMIHILSFITGLFSKREFVDNMNQSIIFRSSKYYERELKKENPIMNQAREIMSTFFTTERKFSVVKLLIGHYMKVTQPMIEHWKEEPEDYIENELAVNQDYNIVAAALQTFYRIITSGDDIASQSYQLIKDAVKDCLSKPQDFETVMLKDACYNALSTSCSTMKGLPNVDFEDFFLEYMVRDFSQNPNSLIHQRIVRVIDGWSSEMLKTEKHSPAIDSAAFQISLACLASEDLVVRIFASISIRSLLEKLDYEDLQYCDFLTTAIPLIVKLADDMTGSPLVIRAVLDNISLLINSLGQKIAPYAEQIIVSVGSLWGSSQTKGMVLGSIVSIMAELVSAIPSCVVVLDKQLLEILQVCCDPRNPHSIALIDPGLGLWRIMIKQQPALSANLCTMFGQMEPLFIANRGDRHTYKYLLELLQWYIIIGNSAFINPNITTIIRCLMLAMASKSQNAVLVNTLDTCHALVMMFPKESPPVLVDVLKENLVALVSHKGNNQYKASYFRGISLFCRILVTNKDFFFAFWEQNGAPIELFLELLIVHLKPEDVVYGLIRNIFIVTLALLLTIPDQRFTQYTIQIIEKCIAFIRMNQENPRETLKLQDNTPASELKTKMEQSQVFANIDGKAILKEKIEECIRINGDAVKQALQEGLKPESIQFLFSS